MMYQGIFNVLPCTTTILTTLLQYTVNAFKYAMLLKCTCLHCSHLGCKKVFQFFKAIERTRAKKLIEQIKNQEKLEDTKKQLKRESNQEMCCKM